MAKNKHKTKHHIVPVSRGGRHNIENIARLDLDKHRTYHHLFGNQTPAEIVDTLVNKYWNGNWSYVEQAYKGRNDGRR